MNRNIFKSTVILMTLTVILLILFSGFFMHTHQLENGKYITHVHPFNKSTDNTPIKTHNHSSEQITFLDHFILIILLPVLMLGIIVSLSGKTIFSSYHSDLVFTINLIKSPRAPPLL